ncbi:MAG TPA: ABC transporter ATP-binding protein [Candidatus Tectomicrobia bacterium]
MDKAIDVSGLTKSYGACLAVDHLSCDVRAGEIFGLLGPNGAGKSTTQRMLTTVLQPTAGAIRICGYDLARSAYPAKRQRGLVPEESNVSAELTAWDNLMFTARLYRVPADERRQRVQMPLERFDLDEQRHVRAEHCSKGLRRRLSLAMALVYRPRVLVLDEPTSGLDVQSTRTIHHQIQALGAEGASVLSDHTPD